MKETYSEIEITYNESDHVFEFEYEGKFITRDTLKKAKEYIDNPPEPKKKNQFVPVAVFYRHWSEMVKGKITSLVDGSYRQECWVTSDAGKREKKSAGEVYLSTPENNEIYQKCLDIDKEIASAREKREALFSTIQTAMVLKSKQEGGKA